MTFDFIQFCKDHNIPFITEGHQHCTQGWVQVHCPFCSGSRDYHLGFNLADNFWSCWRCGWKRTLQAIMLLTNCSQKQALSIIERYEARPRAKVAPKKSAISKTRVVFPTGTEQMNTQHRNYLTSRKFDPEKLERIWHLKGTGPIGSYKFRIIAPIYFHSKLVSYQGRDITGKSPLKYKACSQEQESRPHKHCLYGLDLVKGNSVVVVEGITDAWRLGPGAVALFGIQFTTVQINLLRQFENRYIFFDSVDPQAIVQAQKLADYLSGFPGLVEIIETDCNDPAEMPQDEASLLMSELGV